MDSEATYHKALKRILTKYKPVAETEYMPFKSFKAFAQILETEGGHHHILMVFNSKGLRVSTILHEAIHAVNFIYQSRGVNYDMDNDELLTYYTESIFNLIYPHFFHAPKPK